MLQSLIMGLSVLPTWMIFYYAYKSQLNMPSKTNGAIGLIIIMLLVGGVFPLITLKILYLNGWEGKGPSWEIGIGLLLFLTWFINASYGVYLLSKFLSTHNKDEERNSLP